MAKVIARGLTSILILLFLYEIGDVTHMAFGMYDEDLMFISKVIKMDYLKYFLYAIVLLNAYIVYRDVKEVIKHD